MKKVLLSATLILFSSSIPALAKNVKVLQCDRVPVLNIRYNCKYVNVPASQVLVTPKKRKPKSGGFIAPALNPNTTPDECELLEGVYNNTNGTCKI